jgi:hypothetical protein
MFLLGFQANSKKRSFSTPVLLFWYQDVRREIFCPPRHFEPEVDVDWISTNAANGRP